ncbi:MAG: hypothetical protein Q9217_004810 [Psora testacea]
MAPSVLKKRKPDDEYSTKPIKRIRKQQHYSSPSSTSTSTSASGENEDISPVLDPVEPSEDKDTKSDASIPSVSANEESTSAATRISSPSPPSSTSDSDSEASSTTPANTSVSQTSKIKSKRNDPTAFASSISAILGSKLTTAKRVDPVLSRSATAAEANASVANSKLEIKARRKLREDKKEAFERGRVKDVLLGTDRPGARVGTGNGAEEGLDGEQSVGETIEQERRLRKTAQRGVVKLFNAVRQAQVKAEEARAQGGSRGRKEERVGEMTKKGFLEMVATGGGNSGGSKKTEGAAIEEA